MKNKISSPIGVFDSGIGGLTVANAIVKALPNESIIYFGDTAHLPYGDKSQATIQAYCRNITEMLLAKQCKAIVIACHSASAAAYAMIKKYVGNQALVIDVIGPMISFLHENYRGRKVGLIGTKQTVNSGVYQQKIKELNESFNAQIDFSALATPLFVPVIEEGFAEHPIMDNVIAEYLTRSELQAIDALILGCTHYPIVRDKITAFYAATRGDASVEVLDASSIAASVLRNRLQEECLLNQEQKEAAARYFYVSDCTPAFVASAKVFFGDGIELQAVNW